MAKIPHPDPIKALQGFTIDAPAPSVGADVLRETQPIDPRRANRAALLDDLPEFLTYQVGFQAIRKQDGFINPNSPAWILLGEVAADQVGQELFFNGATVEMASADTGGALLGAGDAVPWGDTAGRGAAIVIGTDLVNGEYADGGGSLWFEKPFEFPGLNRNAAAPLEWCQLWDELPRAIRQPLLVVGWCAGTASGGSTPLNIIKPKQFGAFGRRIGFGQRLQVALVVAKNTFNFPTYEGEFTLYGHCAVQLHFGATVNAGQFNNR